MTDLKIKTAYEVTGPRGICKFDGIVMDFGRTWVRVLVVRMIDGDIFRPLEKQMFERGIFQFKTSWWIRLRTKIKISKTVKP